MCIISFQSAKVTQNDKSKGQVVRLNIKVRKKGYLCLCVSVCFLFFCYINNRAKLPPFWLDSQIEIIQISVFFLNPLICLDFLWPSFNPQCNITSIYNQFSSPGPMHNYFNVTALSESLELG